MTDSEEKRIAEGARVEAFLRDDAVQNALKRLHERYYRDFKSAATPDAREAVWAQAKALDDLCTELAATVDSGTRASVERQRRDRGTRAR